MIPLSPNLTLIICFGGALLVALLPDSQQKWIRAIALTAAALDLFVSATAAVQYRLGEGGFQNIVACSWIPDLGIEFKLGSDGLSLTLLLLTGIIAVAGILFSWETDYRPSDFFAWFLLLVGGVNGVFLSLNLFLLFVFYEIAIIPKYFLIATWGSGRKDYAAMKLVLYSFTSSAFIFFGLLAIYFGSGLQSFDLPRLMAAAQFSHSFQLIFFPVIFFGFAVLAGIWPFHTWAPTGHVAAPTAASMLLAGIVMKLGAYGCLRVAINLLPAGAHDWAPLIAWLAVINIIYGALVALSQTDFKFVIGYSSISHMGFVLLGLATLNSTGLLGASLQMFSHGVIGALLFAFVGSVIYDRTHSRHLADFHLLIERMPLIAWLFIITALASMGTPGFSGFIAEFNVLWGVWLDPHLSRFILFGAGIGIFLTVGYTLVKIHEAFFQKSASVEIDSKNLFATSLTPYPQLSWPERIGIFLLLSVIVSAGIYPEPLIQLINSGILPIVHRLQTIS